MAMGGREPWDNGIYLKGGSGNGAIMRSIL